MVRNATGWVTGMRDSTGIRPPGASVIGSGAGGGGNRGMSLSRHPTGGSRTAPGEGTPVGGGAGEDDADGTTKTGPRPDGVAVHPAASSTSPAQRPASAARRRDILITSGR